MALLRASRSPLYFGLNPPILFAAVPPLDFGPPIASMTISSIKAICL